jgi:hypothetical protein
MAQLDPKQQKDFIRYLVQETEKMKAKETDERVNEVCEKFDKFFGSISKEQKTIFQSFKGYYAARKDDTLNRRQELHKKFEEIYATETSQKTREDMFADAFNKYQDHLLDSSKTMDIANAILPTLSTSQKEALTKKVEGIKELLGFYLKNDF